MDQESNKKQNDEIDLKDLFRSIGNFFQSIYSGFIDLILSFRKLTIKSIKLIGIVVVVSIAVGLGLKINTTPFYESEMIMGTPYLNVGISHTIFDKLNSLCEEENFDALARVLKISKEDATQIKGISAAPFLSEQEVIQYEVMKNRLSMAVKDDKDVEDVIEKLQFQNRSTYRIMVKVYDPNIIGKLESPLVEYLKNNEYVRKRIEIAQQNRLAKKTILENELLKLDTLREAIQKGLVANIERRDRGSNNIFMGENALTANPLEVVRESIRRSDELINIEREIFLQPDFEVIDSFISFEKPAGMRIRDVILYSVLVGLALSYAFIFLREINLYLDRMENRRQEN